MPDTEPALYLALDQGSHASRAVVLDAVGQPVSHAEQPIATHRPQPDWVEHDPEALVGSVITVLDRTVEALGKHLAQLHAAGLATQRSTIVCWDRQTGTALSPVISWRDRRTHAWMAGFAPQRDAIHQTTGLLPSAHYGAGKLRWCLDHLPEVANAHAAGRLAFGPLASFLLHRLLLERPLLTDPANGSRTLLWNISRGNWDPGLLHLFGVPREPLPRCVPTRFPFGTLALGDRQVPLNITTGDQSAALFALGEPRPDTAYVNVGTGAFVQRVVSGSAPHAPGLLTSVVFSDGVETRYALEGTVNGAGSAITWAADALGIEHIEARLPTWLADTSAPPLFLNGVTGLGAPYWVPDFRPRFVGSGTPQEQAVAVVESIVFLLQVNLQHMRAVCPPLKRIQISGGLAALDGLCQRLADLSGAPVHRAAECEATARGTTYLLAGRPSRWPAPGADTRFAPASNTPLTDRYRRWQAAMAGALR